MKKLILATAALLVSFALSAQETVKVGVILPFSGSLAAYGTLTFNGIKLHVDKINAEGGFNGKKIELIVEDNNGDATQSRNAFKKLAGSDKVVAILGPVISTTSLAVRRDAVEFKMPVITPTATNDKVTQRNPYMFRTCIDDSFQGVVIANYLAKTRKVMNAALIVDRNSDYSKGLSKSFKEAYTAAGGKILAEEFYQQKDTDFGAQLKKIASSGAEFVFIPGYHPEVPMIIKQAKVMGLKAKFCGADGWDNDPVINGSGDNIEGCFIVGAFSREDKRKAVQDFLAYCEKNYNGKVGTFEALGYDSITMLTEAMMQGLTGEEISKGLSSIKNLELVTGNASIGEDNRMIKSAVILEIYKTPEGQFATRYLTNVNP